MSKDYKGFGAAVTGAFDHYLTSDEPLEPSLMLSVILDLAGKYGIRPGVPETSDPEPSDL